MGGRAALDDPCTEKGHKNPRRQKKAKHLSHSKSKNRRRYDSQSPSSSSSSLSSYPSSSSTSCPFDSDSDSGGRRIRTRSKDARSRRRGEKHGGFRKRDRSERKRDRVTASRRVKVASKRRKADSSSKPRHESERGRKRKTGRRDRDRRLSTSRSPSSSRSCSPSDSRSSSSSRRHKRHRSTKIDGTIKESQGAGKCDNRVEITQELDDFPSSQSYNSDDGIKKQESQNAKLPSPSSRKVASTDLVSDDAGRKQLKLPSGDGDHSHHNSVQVREQGRGADHDLSQYEPQVAEDSVSKLKSMVVAPAKVSEDNNLELVLRQKALENLRKFRRGNASNVRSSTGIEDGEAQNRPDSSSPAIIREGVEDGSMPEKLAQYAGQKLVSSNEKGVASATQQKRAFLLERNLDEGVSPRGPIGSSVGNQSILISGSSAISGTSNKQQLVGTSNLRASTSSGNDGRFPSGSISVRKEGLDSSHQLNLEPESSNQRMLRQKTLVNRMVEQGSDQEPISYRKEADTTKAGRPASTASSVPGQIPDDCNEGKSNNGVSAEEQLEKKTMTVMRGGEMVQVSYKVYIPKKTPALARRQLQR